MGTFKPIQVRHLDVHEHDIKGRRHEASKRLFAICGKVKNNPKRLEQQHQDSSIDLVVIGGEHAQPDKRGMVLSFDSQSRRQANSFVNDNCCGECRAFSEKASHLDIATHQSRKIPAYGKTKAGSPMGACDRSIGLGKRREEAAKVFTVYSDARVCDGKAHKPSARISGLSFNAERHLAFLSEL